MVANDFEETEFFKTAHRFDKLAIFRLDICLNFKVFHKAKPIL